MQKGSRGTQCESSRGACMSTSRKVETTILAVASSAIFMQLCTNSTTLQSSRHHMRSFDGCFYGLDYVVLLWSGLWSADDASMMHLWATRSLLLLLLSQFRTQPHLGCCLAASTAAASAIFMHLCTNIAPSSKHHDSKRDPART
jgi:hypothetical protein